MIDIDKPKDGELLLWLITGWRWCVMVPLFLLLGFVGGYLSCYYF